MRMKERDMQLVKNADIFTLQSHEVAQYWGEILKFLVMIEDPDWLYEQVYQNLVSAKAQLWGMQKDGQFVGIWITRIEETAQARFGLVWITAGNFVNEGLGELSVARYLECIEPWFREKECEYIEIRGRKGWIRVLPGFKQHSVILRKVL